MDASELISAAQEGIDSSDMKYDSESGRYFDPELNLFYNPNDRSFFDKRSGKYYRRNRHGELIETYQDPNFAPPAPPLEDSEDEDGKSGDETKLTDDQKANIESAQIVDPSSFIDFSSLEPPPPPPPEDDDAHTKEQEMDEPVYHGENLRGIIIEAS